MRFMSININLCPTAKKIIDFCFKEYSCDKSLHTKNKHKNYSLNKCYILYGIYVAFNICECFVFKKIDIFLDYESF